MAAAIQTQTESHSSVTIDPEPGVLDRAAASRPRSTRPTGASWSSAPDVARGYRGAAVTEVDAQLARRLVDSQFPHWAGLPIRPVELSGWDNRTFRLGSELSIRLPTGDWYAKPVDKEERCLPLLAPRRRA